MGCCQHNENPINEDSKVVESGGPVGTERKKQNKRSARNEPTRRETEKLQEEMEDTGQKFADSSQIDVELELVITVLQAGEGRGSSNALQSTHGRPSRWEQYWQRRISQSSKVNSTGCMAGSISQPQRRQYTKGKGQSAGEGEGGHSEKEQRKSMHRVYGPLAPGGRN